MSFLNSAFDSSTFIRTNYNYLKSKENSNKCNVNSGGFNQNGSAKHSKLNTSVLNLTELNQANVIQPSVSNANSRLIAQVSSSNTTGSSSKVGGLGSSGKTSLVTKHHGSTNENRAIWLKHFAAASANAKKAYCSKTQIYCDAVSRALDIQTCKVVPFFGAFLHDLRYIIETVPSVTIMCNKNIQKPIEVKYLFF